MAKENEELGITVYKAEEDIGRRLLEVTDATTHEGTHGVCDHDERENIDLHRMHERGDCRGKIFIVMVHSTRSSHSLTLGKNRNCKNLRW
jgi:hypothetical protein